MRTGRPPKPTSLHVLDGTFRPDRHTEVAVPEAEPGHCPPPDSLSEAARRVWEERAPEMVAKGLLRPRYSEMFEVWCIAVVNMRRASAIVDATGPVIKGRQEQVVSNPASRETARWARIVQLVGSELGLSPASVSMIGRAQAKPEGASPERLLG
jgi:P27 family predicted phage terminase small subunit